MESIDYLRALQRRWLIVLATTLLGLAAGFLTAQDAEDAPTTYQATHTLSVVQPSVTATLPIISFTPSQLAVYATVGEVPRRAAAALNYPGTPQELADEVEAVPDDAVGVLELTVTSTSGSRAARIANTFGQQLTEVVGGEARDEVEEQIRLARRQVDDLQTQIDDLDAQIAGNPANVAVITARRDALVNQYRIAFDEYQTVRGMRTGGPPVVTLEQAIPETVARGYGLPVGRTSRTIIVGLIGLALGAALALVLDRIDTRVRTQEDAESATGHLVVGEIPYLPRRHRSEIITVTRPASPFAEAYRNLRTNLAFSRPTATHPESNGADQAPPPRSDRDPKVILVTSPGPYEGKSTTVAHLAATYAETGGDVLVLDCDFRRPRQHRIFGTRESPGLSDTLDDPTRFNAANEIICETSVPGVRLAPAGTPADNPARLFIRARALIEASRRRADIVLIDTPPYLVANDAAELAPFADAVLLVIQARRTRRENATNAAELLDRQEAPVAGVVLVRTDEARSGYSTYYYYRANARTHNARRRWRRLLRLGPPKGSRGVRGDAPADEPGDDRGAERADRSERVDAPANGQVVAETDEPVARQTPQAPPGDSGSAQ